ncbi:apolipoprotein N-acyltransferase [Corynebacterium sp. TA-R-1]|uniref:Apolipoprotein N-acyltransferase n=1 Tax=Corynebacterium stercoris TaxID=2943490 RepID=A0ABT1G2T3_9CORY|nr:apolipoprotein N-acyltransferase [Corynebacterium stercoris]
MIAFLRFGLAAIGGWLVYFSYEPIGISLAAPLGIGLFYLALMPWSRRFTAATGMAGEAQEQPGAGFGALLGFVHALVTYLFLLPWIGEFVGAMPYVALSIFLALYGILTGIFGVLIARWRYGFLAFPFVYLAVEFARSSFPFGGFAWVRLAWGQINGPLANLAPWGGPALVTLAAVFAGVGLVMPWLTRDWRQRIAIACFLVPLVVGWLAGFGVNRDAATVDTVRAAAVQGNVPRMGLDFNAQRRAVLANHVNETIALGQEAAQEGQPLDLVVWPENASDVNPFMDAEAAALIDSAVQAVNAPTMVGTLTRDEVGDRNTQVVFDPVTGPGDYHHKRYLQPFGEYMPMRDFFRNFSDLVDLAGDFKPGDGPGVVRMGDVTLGVATCYEVAEDPAYRMAVRNGAQILATPTNNATFGFTDMTYQQLAMSRMRAIETDRAVIVAATSGVSAIVHPDGTVSQQTQIFTADHLVEELPLRERVTPAVRFGGALEWVLVLAGLAVMIGAAATARRGYAATGSRAVRARHETHV